MAMMECQSTGLAGQCAIGKGAQFGLTALPGFSLLSLCSVAGILLLICCPPLHSLSRKLLRPTVLFHVERGLSWVELAQKKQQAFLTTLCAISCLTVSPSFYTAFLPLIMWAGELQLGSRAVILMSFLEYVGNGIKDLICAPRPMGHPKGAGKTKLLLSERRSSTEANFNSLEYGLPSSHTMHTLCLDFYIAHYLITRDRVPYQYAIAIYSLVTIWVLWIGFSRVYMGMHTPIDILGGAIIAIMVLSSYLTIDDRYEAWVMHDKYAFLKQLAFTAVLLKLHPMPLQFTPSYQNSVIFAGVALGAMGGLQFSHKEATYPGLPERRLYLSAPGLISLLLRLLIGGTLTGIMKEVSKALATRLLSPVYAAMPPALRRLWAPPIYSLQQGNTMSQKGIPVDKEGVPWDVYTTVRFVSYGFLAWAATGASFRIFWYFEPKLNRLWT